MTTHRTRAVFFSGPEPYQNRDGDECPEWAVYIGDEHGDPTGPVYRVHEFQRGLDLAQRMASDRRLELVADAVRA